MPEMLRTIVGDLLRCEPDLIIVGSSDEREDPIHKARASHADVLITRNGLGDTAGCIDQILTASPISILAISDDGRSADAVSLVRRPVSLNGGNPSRLPEAVREIAEHSAASNGTHAQRPV